MARVSREKKTIEKALVVLGPQEGSKRIYLSKKLQERLDSMSRVFQLVSGGTSKVAIAKMLGISRKTVYNRYYGWIELTTGLMIARLGKDPMEDVTEHLMRLEKTRDDIAFEIEMIGASEGDTPTRDTEVLLGAKRGQLLEYNREIANIKKGLKIWQPMERGEIKEIAKEKVPVNLDDKRRRVIELLEKARGSNGNGRSAT